MKLINLKTITSLALIALLSSTKADAQGFKIGIKAGANVYKNNGEDLENKYKAFPFAGAYLGFAGEKVSLVAEGLFTQTRMIVGNNFNQVFNAYIQNGKDQIKNAKFSFSELSVPILLGYKLLPSTWIEIGPQFTKIVNIKDDESLLNEVSQVHKDSYLSGVIGLRVQLPLNLNLSGRYIQGFSNRNNSSVNERWTTQHFQIGLGFGL